MSIRGLVQHQPHALQRLLITHMNLVVRSCASGFIVVYYMAYHDTTCSPYDVCHWDHYNRVVLRASCFVLQVSTGSMRNPDKLFVRASPLPYGGILCYPGILVSRLCLIPGTVPGRFEVRSTVQTSVFGTTVFRGYSFRSSLAT